MTFFEFLDKAKYYVFRYLLPVGFLVVGIILLIMAGGKEIELNNDKTQLVKQSPMFLYASLFFLMASVIWFLYLFGIVKSIISYVIIGIMVVSSAWLIYSDYMNVKRTVDFDAAVEVRDFEIKTRMDDIKQAQLAYKEMNGHYTDSMDDLIAFVKTGKKMKIYKQGSIPERKITPEERDYLYGDDRPIDKLMTEVEADLLSVSPFAATDTTGLIEFKRDTTFVSVIDAVFLDEKRQETRGKIGGEFEFHPDSLRYVPFTKTPVKMDTGSVEKGDFRVPTLYFAMSHPMNDKLKDDTLFYSIGALDDNTLRESWKDR